MTATSEPSSRVTDAAAAAPTECSHALAPGAGDLDHPRTRAPCIVPPVLLPHTPDSAVSVCQHDPCACARLLPIHAKREC